MMVSSNIRDILTSFSPSLDYFAISTGDGRIRIWDSLKGQVPIEFSDIQSTDTNVFTKSGRAHLSLDYTCMKWLSLDRKKKRKLGSSLLILGTGSGDLLALDVMAGQLKWGVSDCHPGGVSAISISAQDACIYTGGADSMVCRIDSQTGNIVEKFKASSKAISCVSVSPDGKMLATAASQVKIFHCSDHKKMQKFYGHPGAVRSMIFTEDGEYVLSSAIGERYIAVWSVDGSKKKSASCVLAMEHPAVFLDSRSFGVEGADETRLYVLAISETGVCYIWCGHNLEELRNAKPTKMSMSIGESFHDKHKGSLPAIYAARLQGFAKPMGVHVFMAYGLLVKPLFQKMSVQSGTDITLNISRNGVLLPESQSLVKSKRRTDGQTGVTALDRANLDDAILPIPRVSDFSEKDNSLSVQTDEVMGDFSSKDQAESGDDEDDIVKFDGIPTSIEEHVKELKILANKDDIGALLDDPTFKCIDIKANIPLKKMKLAISSIGASNAYKLLEVLLSAWQSRTHTETHVLPWVYCILTTYGHYIAEQETPDNQIFSSLLKVTKSRCTAIQPLLQLLGRLQLVSAQIDKAALKISHDSMFNGRKDDSDNDDEDDVEEQFYREDDESELSSDDD